jgi:hypothetical protein
MDHEGHHAQDVLAACDDGDVAYGLMAVTDTVLD